MTVTIKVNYQTTFQKKEAKKIRLNRRRKSRDALFSFLKLLSVYHPKNKESKITFRLLFFLALISQICYSCDSDYKIKGACYEKSSFIRRNQDL